MVQVKDKARVMISCWLCGEPVEVRWSKKGKPYLICDNCGQQIFLREDKAVKLLNDKIREGMKHG